MKYQSIAENFLLFSFSRETLASFTFRATSFKKIHYLLTSNLTKSKTKNGINQIFLILRLTTIKNTISHSNYIVFNKNSSYIDMMTLTYKLNRLREETSQILTPVITYRYLHVLYWAAAFKYVWQIRCHIEYVLYPVPR